MLLIIFGQRNSTDVVVGHNVFFFVKIRIVILYIFSEVPMVIAKGFFWIFISLALGGIPSRARLIEVA